MIQQHAEAGYNILKGVEFPWPVAQTILQHHERLDGSGYPQGLASDAILQEAKVLAVADVLDAMMTRRPYREGLGLEAALRGTLKILKHLKKTSVWMPYAGLGREGVTTSKR